MSLTRVWLLKVTAINLGPNKTSVVVTLALFYFLAARPSCDSGTRAILTAGSRITTELLQRYRS